MEQKRVSFKIAKAIKEARYSQDKILPHYTKDGEYHELQGNPYCDAPTYLEVWLWLWREKHIAVEADYSFAREGWTNGGICGGFFTDPEEAIIAGIEYLCDNDLIK